MSKRVLQHLGQDLSTWVGTLQHLDRDCSGLVRTNIWVRSQHLKGPPKIWMGMVKIWMGMVNIWMETVVVGWGLQHLSEDPTSGWGLQRFGEDSASG